MNYPFRMDVFHALSDFQYLLARRVNIRIRGRSKSHTRSCISTIDGFAFFLHWTRVPFFIYGETRNDEDSFS